jgi:hypothetical protein
VGKGFGECFKCKYFHCYLYLIAILFGAFWGK